MSASNTAYLPIRLASKLFRPIRIIFIGQNEIQTLRRLALVLDLHVELLSVFAAFASGTINRPPFDSNFAAALFTVTL